jgi:hypothetical protein
MRIQPSTRGLACTILVLGALSVIGCSVERRTQVMLEIDATCEVRALADGLDVVVEGDGTRSEESFAVGPASGWPRRIALIPRGGDAARAFRVTVSARGGALVVASSFVTSGYEAQRTLGLRVVLDERCGSCAQGSQACLGGACGDPASGPLPEWAPGTPACVGTFDAGPLDAAYDGGRDGGTDGGTGGVPELDFCRELVAASCEGRILCCDAAAMETVDACRTANEDRCRTLLEPLTSNSDIVYDPLVAAAALAELRAAASTCDLSIPDLLLTPTGVLRAWDGPLTRGMVCGRTLNPLVNDALCAGDRSCRAQSAVRRVCADRVGEGMPCRDWLDCTEGLYCMGGTVAIDGTCRPRLADGQSCMAYSDCASLLCEESLCQPRTEESVYCADPYGTM